MVSTTGDVGPISQVREGMRVVDAAGDDVGTVAEVRMSDPASVTAPDLDPAGSGGLLDVVADAFGGGDGLPRHEQERLARLGYLRIDASGFLASDRYAAADEIAGVTGDAVHLTVAAERLVG